MKRILLADDHSFVRLGLMQILKDAYPFASIREVADGESLVKEVSKQDWDLVISDLEMPGRGGLEALEQIKLIRPGLPVLILSMHTENLYAVRSLRAGASGFLNKAAAPYELIKAIERIESGRKYITPEIAEKLIGELDEKNQLHNSLSTRQFEIFRLLASGKSTMEIGEMLMLAPSTVSTHRKRIMEKLKLRSNYEMTRYAITHSIIPESEK